MDILLKPDSLSLAGSMNHIVISSTNDITFVLKYADNNQVIVQHIYIPNKDKKVDINLETIITPLLSFQWQDTSTPYQQTRIARKFVADV